MRRALLSLTGLVAGTTLLVSLKSAPGASRLPGQVVADNAAIKALASGSATPAAPGSAGLPAAPPVTIPTAPGAPAPTSGPPSKPPASKAPTAPASKPPTAPGGTPSVILGDSVPTEFGFVTVGVTVSGGRLTDVIADELPGDEPRSISISTKAAPVLRQRALAAQSATFDSVSGATYTSAAYKESLQSALEKAGLATG